MDTGKTTSVPLMGGWLIAAVIGISLPCPVRSESGNAAGILNGYTAELRKNPSDQALREKIIKLVLEMEEKPAIPDDVPLQEGAAEYALKSAKTVADYADAARAYEEALLAAPWVAANYLACGGAYEKEGEYEAAIRCLKLYLLAAPNAADAYEVRKRIGGLAYAAEKTAKDRAIVAARQTLVLNLGGGGDGVKLEALWIEALKGWAGKYEVANDQFRRFKAEHNSGDYEGHSLNGDRQPAANVTYDEAVRFCEWLNKTCSSQIPRGYEARLPDGDEWSTLARCGDGREYPWGAEWPPIRGNYADETEAKALVKKWGTIGGYDDGSVVSCVVEASGRNEWGLYGVGGNVWEWTRSADRASRVLRGASWNNGYKDELRCETRYGGDPAIRYSSVGLRIVVLRLAP